MFAASKSGQVAAAAVTTDPFFPYVPLLLETTSTNGQQNNTFLDSSTNNYTITRNGTPTQGSVTPYWPNGYWSNFFNGSTDYLTPPSNAAFTLGTGDFTIEAWIYPTSNSTIQGVIGLADGGSLGSFVLFYNVGSFAFSSGKVSFINIGGTGASSTGSVSPNTWTHIAVSRASGSLKMFFNGVLDSTTAFTDNSTKTVCTVGRPYTTLNQEYFPGYISNLRIVKGTAVYTSAFTPPTTPLTAITNTSLLTCQSNRFIDNSTNNFTITANGTPRTQAFQPFSPTASYTAAAYGGSGYFNGSTDYLTGTSPNLSGTWTIEFWWYPTSVSAQQTIISFNAGAFSGINIFCTTSGQLNVDNGVTGQSSFTTVAFKANQWNHVAIVRNVTTTTGYINGAVAGSHSFTPSTTSAFSIGRFNNPAYYYVTGYLSNVRVVNGTAVYTSAFTPPTAPVTAITNTSLLTNFTNAGIYDAAVQNNAITVGDAQASTTQSKWSPTSMKFDGTGDYLQSPFQPQFQFGSGNFTIEFWIYFNSVAGNQRIVGQDNTASNITFAIYMPTSGALSYYLSSTGSSWNIASGVSMGTVATGIWYYVALVRNGSTFTPYINSVAGTTTTSSSALFASTAPLTIGADAGAGPGSFLNGYIQDFRITKGVARTITTPTAAFPTR